MSQQPIKQTSLRTMTDAARAVWSELKALHLLTDPIAGVDVIWCALPQVHLLTASGFFLHGDSVAGRALGYAEGHIYIPALAMHGTHGLRAVIRHEYAHAIAHHYPRLVRSKEFRRAFGGSYSSEAPGPGEDGDFVSRYARTCPREDYAETFAVYLQHQGCAPPRPDSKAIRVKWRFLDELRQLIKAGKKRWP